VPEARGNVHITPYQKSKGDFGTILSGGEADMVMNEWRGRLTLTRLSVGRHSDEILKVRHGQILNDSHIRLDGEHIDRTNRYQLFRVQGLKDRYPVLGGVFIQIGVDFTNDDLEDAFSLALQLAKQSQYAVLFAGDEAAYRPPQQT
jgi:hypothetical protein